MIGIDKHWSRQMFFPDVLRMWPCTSSANLKQPQPHLKRIEESLHINQLLVKHGLAGPSIKAMCGKLVIISQNTLLSFVEAEPRKLNDVRISCQFQSLHALHLVCEDVITALRDWQASKSVLDFVQTQTIGQWLPCLHVFVCLGAERQEDLKLHHFEVHPLTNCAGARMALVLKA